MARWLNEKQTAVNTGILNVAVTLGSELFAKVSGVLVLDIFHNWIPAGDKLAQSR